MELRLLVVVLVCLSAGKVWGNMSCGGGTLLDCQGNITVLNVTTGHQNESSVTLCLNITASALVKICVTIMCPAANSSMFNYNVTAGAVQCVELNNVSITAGSNITLALNECKETGINCTKTVTVSTVPGSNTTGMPMPICTPVPTTNTTLVTSTSVPTTNTTLVMSTSVPTTNTTLVTRTSSPSMNTPSTLSTSTSSIPESTSTSESTMMTGGSPVSTTPMWFIIAISSICALIAILVFFICCLSCILCSLLGGGKGSKQPQVKRWADTEQGNVELLAMKTLSETMLENESSDTVTVEEGKKESFDGRGKEELGALTANTFGFQGEVVKNEEKPTVEGSSEKEAVRESEQESDPPTLTTFSMKVATMETPSTKQSGPVDSTPSTSAPSSEATPTTVDVPPSSEATPSTPVTSSEKPSPAVDNPPTSGGEEAKPSSSTDTSTAADSHVSTDEPASDTGKPKVTFSNDIEKILGGDLKQETQGTAL